jgi:hypothetical protein
MRLKAIRLASLLSTFALVGSIGMGQTSSSTTPDQVEEDWQIVVTSPNSVEVGPQITTCMSPVSDGSTSFVAFDLNYRDYPSFQAGGMQAKVYATTGDVVDSSSLGDQSFNTSNETISWTQRMSLSGESAVTYTVVNGQSTTWGPFGQAQGLLPVNFTASITSLSAYSPAYSVAQSGAGWQSNRVSQMTLVRVRYYSRGQLISTDNTSRSVSLGDTSGQ